MPSKGVDYYAYSFFTNVNFTKPTDWGKSTQTYTFGDWTAMSAGNLQIDESDIGITSHYGRFQWDFAFGDTGIAGSGYADIAPSTGDLGSSTMGVMLQTPSIVTADYALSFGFYDSGPGYGSLTNQDQSYVYLTNDFSNWMGLILQDNPQMAEVPLAGWALPGAHDSGMFDMTEVSQLLANASFLGALAGVVGEFIVYLGTDAIQRAVVNLSVTQKDDITTMLNLGTRYFDFRPGYCYDSIADGIFHQHNFIPGYPFASFLQDVFTWAAANPSEIVVVSLNFQGFAQSTMQPDVGTITSMIAQYQQDYGPGVNVGNKTSLGTTYADLVASNTRVIFLNQIGAQDDASKYDSYDDNYTTTNVQNIIDALEGMEAAQQPVYDYTVLQLQGTASGLGGGIFASIATMSDASSPLMSTKANFDNATYTWLLDNVANDLSNQSLVVFLNDFTDNVLAYLAFQISVLRSPSTSQGQLAGSGAVTKAGA